jgi:hypothetical protein
MTTTMADISNEGRVQLAIDAYKKGLYPSMTTLQKHLMCL